MQTTRSKHAFITDLFTNSIMYRSPEDGPIRGPEPRAFLHHRQFYKSCNAGDSRGAFIRWPRPKPTFIKDYSKNPAMYWTRDKAPIRGLRCEPHRALKARTCSFEGKKYSMASHPARAEGSSPSKGRWHKHKTLAKKRSSR